MAFLLSRTAAIIPGAGVVPHHPSRRSPRPCLIPSSSPISKRKPGKHAGRRRRGDLDDRIPAGVGKREQASKTRTTNDHPHPHHRTGHGPNLTPNRIDRPAHPTSTQRDARTRRRNNRRRRVSKTNTETTRRTTKRKRTGLARRQASKQRDARRDARRDDDDKEKASSMRR